MPRAAYDTTGTPKPKNGLSEDLQQATPHDAQAHHPKRVWWAERPPPTLHRETALYQKDFSEANSQHLVPEKAGHDASPNERA